MKKNLKKFFSVILIACAFPSATAFAENTGTSYQLRSAAIVDVAKLLKDGEESFRKINAENFFGEESFDSCKFFFDWTSSDHTSARYPATKLSDRMKFFSERPVEVIFRFKKDDGALEKIDVSFFNKGDSRAISETEMRELVAKLDGELTTFTGVKGQVSRKKLSSKAVINKNVRQAKGLVYSLKWSGSKIKNNFTAEYVNLEISLASADGGMKSASEDNYSVKGAGEGLAKNVEKMLDGSVVIRNIPMVDQGEKGYCAVAVSERIMRYFGNDNFDQHVFAQMAQSSSAGTSVDDLVGAFKRISAKAGIKVYEKILLFEKVKDLDKLIAKYNSAARKAKKVKIKTISERGQTIYVSQIFADMDPGVYLASRTSDKTDYKKFLDTVKASVDKGIPVVWGVLVNIYPEKRLPQTGITGHLRLIIGYNAKEKIIFYSDTWGEEHECKEMDYDTAWAMTMSVIQIEPRK